MKGLKVHLISNSLVFWFLLAIGKAVDIAIQFRSSNVIVLTDYLSVLLSMKYPHISVRVNPYLLDIKKKVIEFYRTNVHTHMKFVWVPSHIRLKGNQQAHRVAKINTRNEPNNFPIFYTDVEEIFRQHAKQETRNFILHEGEKKGKQFDSFY